MVQIQCSVFCSLLNEKWILRWSWGYVIFIGKCPCNQYLWKKRKASRTEWAGCNGSLTITSGANMACQRWPILDGMAKSFNSISTGHWRWATLGRWGQLSLAEAVFANSVSWRLSANRVSSSWVYNSSLGELVWQISLFTAYIAFYEFK